MKTATDPEKLTRARSTSKDQYEGLWSRTSGCVEEQIGAGVRDIGVILDAIQAQSWEWFNKRYFREVAQAVGIDVRRERLDQRLAVRDGVYQIVPYDSRVADLPQRLAALIEGSAVPVDNVVELGSGYGHNLFKLYGALTPAARAGIRFHACELSDAGRAVTERLHALEPEMPLTVREFDYYRPNFDFLDGAQSVLAFSSHSIEQIPELSAPVYRALLGAAARCVGVHAEPVGWQYQAELVELRSAMRARTKGGLLAALDGFVFSAVGVGLSPLIQRDGIEIGVEDLGKADRVSRNAALWSARADYNKNLVSLLGELAGEKLLRLREPELNAYGDNPFNPTTLITWENA